MPPLRWLTEDDIGVLDENRQPGETLIRRIAADGFAAPHSIGL